ncbi:formate dehydrogenase accessory protein FdhE [Salipaludibacillus sp. HK11]|uniref:formate dehydrogenase accessory protein FdhE n=1 Tax=Salipaludibacillus sp. HK11 TaxID=3394320 RepID=UPI0039FBE6D7
MMNPNVVSEDYLNLQKSIIRKQDELREQFSEKMDFDIKKEDLDVDFPVLPQLTFSPVSGELYRESIHGIVSVISEYQPGLEEELSKLTSILTDEDIVKWIKESVTFNTVYFQTFSERNRISDWLPHFLAEQALRPFMQLLASKCRWMINDFDVMGTCPCCGEPHRLAKTGNDEKKVLSCPRCETEWKQKKVACVHCGDDREGHLFYIKIKEDEVAKIEACQTCTNYLKVIDTSKMLERKTAALLDLESIHLDFVAQEEGYGGEAT